MVRYNAALREDLTMSGEPILIVDDTPVNLKLTRILLMNEGYTVQTAASAEEALEMLRSYRPRLILADIQLPGMDGLAMTRLIKQDQATRDIAVVALTAFAMKGDEQKAMDAGCDGYITKPIDTRTLGERIRQLISGGVESAPPVEVAPEQEATPSAEIQAMRHRFLQEGQERTRQLLSGLEDAFPAKEAARAMHQWAGTGGLLGYTALARLAREVEGLLLERPVDTAQVRETLTNLLLAFSTPREAQDAPIPGAIVRALRGKCAAIVGLPAHETQRLLRGPGAGSGAGDGFRSDQLSGFRRTGAVRSGDHLRSPGQVEIAVARPGRSGGRPSHGLRWPPRRPAGTGHGRAGHGGRIPDG